MYAVPEVLSGVMLFPRSIQDYSLLCIHSLLCGVGMASTLSDFWRVNGVTTTIHFGLA